MQRSATSWHRLAPALLKLVALAAATPSIGAAAPAMALSKEEQLLLVDNPTLRRLAVAAPELLSRRSPSIRMLVNPALPTEDGLDENAMPLRRQNPALFEVWRSSSEASVELWALSA